MSRALIVAGYKLRFFFGPALRGRFGVLVYLALIVLFVPSGFAAGMALGTTLANTEPSVGIAILSLPLAGILSLALLYSLGAGVTAHASEFDFLMTAELPPRSYLVADLVFQFTTLLAGGGLAAGVAAFAIVSTMGRPLWTVVPLVAILVAYAFLVLMVSQILVVARVRHPKRPIRLATVALIAVSVLPAISFARPDVPLRFQDLPFPSTAFAYVAYAVLQGAAVDLTQLVLLVVYLGVIGLAWAAASDTYIFHGIRPTLSAGFGQVDMSYKLDSQRRLIGTMGGLTTRVRLHPERGGETGLMARLHLLRIWRDGSVLFVVLFAGISFAPVLMGGGTGGTNAVITVTQLLTFLLAILAMNWSYYERENLWLVITSGIRPGSYFRGLLLSLAVVGLLVAGVFVVLLTAISTVQIPLSDLALPFGAPIAAALTAAALLTRVKVKPSAFSPAILGILFLVALVGFLGGIGGQTLVLAAGLAWGLGEAVQASLLAAYVVVIATLGLWGVTRLAAGFRL